MLSIVKLEKNLSRSTKGKKVPYSVDTNEICDGKIYLFTHFMAIQILSYTVN